MPDVSSHPCSWLTRFAWVILLSLVVARVTIVETVYGQETQTMPGSAVEARSPGPAASLVLDALCFVPAILILARRVMDRHYALRGFWSLALMGALGLWMALSVLWAADRFAATVSAFNFISSLALLWSAVQLVRGWRNCARWRRFYSGCCWSMERGG